ncbi:MAG: TPM domain-containing protein [Sphingobacteriia bacterium]|nr:MAG: TPM domain-containing protein [Sphingobacteriia bacterium]
MKKLLFILFFLGQLGLGLAQDLLPRPNPPRLVNDVAGVLSPEQKQILEDKLVALDDSSSNQIAIVLLPSLNGADVADYANKLFRAWGIGDKKTNNGVLILASIEDRKIWIEIGYGLEGAIPDVTASSIYRNEIVPEFKQQNYYRGLDRAIDALAKAAVGEYKVKREKNKGTGSSGKDILKFILIVIVVIFILARGSGGRGGGMMSRRGAGNIAEALFWSSLLGGGNRSSGSSWGGGGFGGGGGGGFGGFGGGSSGGGGAGGGW